MKLRGILIEEHIKEKILWKHGITAREIEEVLLDSPLILKVSKERYIAVGHSNRFITIIFETLGTLAFIVTSYLSSDVQRKLYKHKRRL